MIRELELLAPARDLVTGIAAVDFGADAVYIGGAHFGARYAASNSTDDIRSLVEYAHGFGVRIYATLNTVVYEKELDQARVTALELIDAGVDALIVQDMAFMRMGLEGVEMHASTQTCNITPHGVAFLAHSGFSRVILERSLTMDQIGAIRAATDVDLECFVHGAICVGNSGRCYLSRTMSSRSGNRGECSQPCRLPYDLVDGVGREILKAKHLLSVRDINLSSHVSQLIDAGVNSFKIEGRLKDIGYIKNIVSYYRDIIDSVIDMRNDLVRSSVGYSLVDFKPDPSKSFTRGSSLYFIEGKTKGVASFDTPKSIGNYIGRISTCGRDSFSISGVIESLSAGDGVCFMASGELIGTNINRVDGDKIFPNKMDGLVRGVDLYRNYDHRFSMAVQRSRTVRKIDVSASVSLCESELMVHYIDCEGVGVAIARGGEFELARNPAKMLDTLNAQLAKSGDTMFNVIDIDTIDVEPRFVTVSMLNDIRREALEMLRQKRSKIRKPISIAVEDLSYPYPVQVLDGSGNVVNSLAEQFYIDHGVRLIEPGFDLRPDMAAQRVIRSSYCLRREIGECLRERSTLKGELFLVHGDRRYRLEFDCKECCMNLIFEK